MAKTDLTVYKANPVIEAGYRLSINEQRVVLACIGQVNSQQELFDKDEFELSAKEFATIFEISEARAYSELQNVAKTLYQRSVTIYNPDPNRPKLKKIETRWISSIGYLPEDGKITLCFAPKMLPFLSQLKGTFTKYKLKHVANMTCVYAIRLYELLMQWQTLGKREVEIDWLKQQFQIEGLYADMADFKKRVIEPAIKDINQHSNLNVTWTQRKTGRKVTHLTFCFAEKETAKSAPKPKEERILGIKKSEIERQARTGESWEDAARRIKREKSSANQRKAAG